MGYRIIEYGGEKYKLTPKWYKQYLSALELMRKVKETNIDELDVSELVDIREVKIDRSKPQLIRIISYINQVKNPYCFRAGNSKVRVSYANKDESLNDSFVAMLSHL